MATNKKATNKKATKPVEEIMITEVVKPTDEELFLGAEDEIKTVKVVDYASLKRRYRIHNLKNSRVYEIHGRAIGAIVGNDESVKQQLKEGATKVELFRYEGKEKVKTHIIEVIK